MPVFKSSLLQFSLDKGRFTKALDTAIQVQVQQAARAFLRIAFASVPVRTGFALGAFRNLANFAGIELEFQKARRFRRFEFYTGSGQRVLKTPESSKRFATPTSGILKKVDEVYTFRYNITITYFNINDFSPNPRTPSSPWRSFERGRAFFEQYLRTVAIRKLPKVQSFITKSLLQTSESRATKTQLGQISRDENG